MSYLVPQEKYLEAGVHIGTRTKTPAMARFVYKAREDGLHVLDLKKTEERIKAAAKLMSRYPKGNVGIIGNKENARSPIKKFCEVTGSAPLFGRFTPGKFTNPAKKDFLEPEVILVVDPSYDRQAIREASEIGVPVIALCDTNNMVRFIDLVIPTNNKGKKAIALIFWVLARELLKERGDISSDDEFKATPEEFENA
jgi:small subunit ribosomal protein S2